MDGYVLGVDGGGTKTEVCIADLKGELLYSFKAGAINLNGESEKNVRDNLKCVFSAVNDRIGGFEHLKAVCIGAAGISNGDAGILLETGVLEAGYNGRLLITGDHRTALCGALGITEGIILISGTGSICCGVNSSGEEHRTGGFGYLIDDEGSGYAIGRDILKAVVRAWDGREKGTLLTGMVFKKLGVSSVEEIISLIYSKDTNKRDIAALAPVLTAACAQGDEEAEGIAAKCGNELLKLVRPVAERLGLQEGCLAMCGSILQNDRYIRTVFLSGAAQQYPRLSCVAPKHNAAYGAVLMALEQLNNI